MNIQEVIQALFQFSDRIFTKEAPADRVDIEKFEERYGLKLPQDYIELLLVTNGCSLMGSTVYGVGASATDSLDELYIFEHTAVENEMYDYLVPFSPDGFGNHYCFDTRSHGDRSCLVVFWQHDYEYTAEDVPEITHDSFAGWVKTVMIGWTLEAYDHEGNRR
ncbi:MAG: SMI1/KNR4 family protein [Candidatus Pseudobacter hemicellulosilyticus]|uniref:SMI1/KNR4 family protein n=1 Tax=Candidatus Pseudobacter hemicellulosilyticus TaxID=3121375 RepID=A0AAJ5WSW0_9BACT|nr:MAG: SMI1/KNR4 family protein [Pseudobacter sp.]